MKYIIAIIIITILAIIGSLTLIGREQGSNNPSKVARSTKLAEYSDKDSSSISWTMQGRLIGEDQRHSVRITVTKSKRTVALLSGYEERVEKSTDYMNTPAAYEAFARSLDTYNFGKERRVRQPDERGVCPLGNRFVYRLTDFGKEIMRTWSDTCSSSNGSYGGGNSSAQVIGQLFKAQITDYSKFISGTQF